MRNKYAGWICASIWIYVVPQVCFCFKKYFMRIFESSTVYENNMSLDDKSIEPRHPITLQPELIFKMIYIYKKKVHAAFSFNWNIHFGCMLTAKRKVYMFR